MATATTAYIGLGSNLGERKGCINKALEMLGETSDVEVTGVSDIIETAPLAQPDEPRYLNAVARIETTLSARDLHEKLSGIEASLGRVRREKWAPRTIDLDLLLFGDAIIDTEDLSVPHPQMHLRSFVLSGLCQLDGRLQHPVLKESMNELAARLSGGDFALNPDVPQLVSVAGTIGVGKTTLTRGLSQTLRCKGVLEAYDANPFLADVYAGKKELALDSQLFFLTSRLVQLNREALAQEQIVISDYVFDKELIYARRLLDAQQQALYEKVYQPLHGKVAAPVLVIYLQDFAEGCLERIRRRNRPYEQAIELQFLEELSADYQQLFADWKLCPVIRISMSEFDCSRKGDIEHVADQIRGYVAV